MEKSKLIQALKKQVESVETDIADLEKSREQEASAVKRLKEMKAANEKLNRQVLLSSWISHLYFCFHRWK